MERCFIGVLIGTLVRSERGSGRLIARRAGASGAVFRRWRRASRSPVSWRKAAGTVVAAALLMAAQAAAADESGTFRMLRSYQHSYVTIDHGVESFTGGTLQGTYSIIASSGAPFVDGVHGRSECLVYSRSGAGGISLEAPCVNVDAAGDRFHVVSIREQGTIAAGGGGAGRWELRGGTGAYAGVAGRCTYRTHYLEGGWLVSVGDCTWSRS